MNNKSTLKYYAAGVIAFVMWGAFAIPLKLIKAYASIEILQYRVFTALLMIAVFILIFRRDKLKVDIRTFSSGTKTERLKLGGLVLLSSALLMGNWYTYIYAVNHVSLTSAAFAYMVCPLLTAFGGFFILKENLTSIKLVALVIALISIMLLATGSLREVTWSVVIASLYALYLIIQRFITQVDKLNMLAINLLLSAMAILPYYFTHHAAVPTDPTFWVVIVIIALVFTLIPLFLNLFALIQLPSATLGIIMYINPIIAFLIAFFHFNEPFNLHQVMSYSLLFIAIVIFNWNVLSGMFNRKTL